MHLTKILEHYMGKRKQRRKNNTRDNMQKQNNNFKSLEVQRALPPCKQSHSATRWENLSSKKEKIR
jgi:hypothetical protein